jgi:hypothetical protein
MSRVIEVTGSPAGEATVQTKGYAGPACLEASRFLEQALGVRTAEAQTAEFHQSATAEQPVAE